MKTLFNTWKKTSIALTVTGAIVMQASAAAADYFILGADPEKNSGVYQLTIDSYADKKYQIEQLIATQDPSYIAISNDYKALVAVNEEPNSGAFAYSYQAGNWSAAASIEGLGDYPCHISWNQNTNLVSVATYVSPNYSILDFDGKNFSLSGQIINSGKGPHERQDAPHPHWMGWSPEGKFLYGVDLGTDSIFQFSPKNGVWMSTVAAKLQAGDGPRHLAFHPTKNYAYVLNELSNTLVAYQQSGVDGSLTQIQRINTLSTDKKSQAAAIRLSADGKFIYLTNRGENSIAVFKVLTSGKVELVQHISTNGNWPRDFNFSYDQAHLLVANRLSNNIAVYSRDKNTGKLTDLGFEIKAENVKFVQGVPAGY
ncbi:lactonase family protein [Catenovulum sp. SX2]|uniref:lactonase family protein n=1 Tax=Catenovulum sp. SX2 TaxID=3398614 RepID=UPI003F848307